jgi:isopenicillin-N epimerase
VGARPDDLVFVQNATSGCNAVLGSLALSPGDEIVITNHGYNACNNAAAHVCERAGARLRIATVPYPLHSEDEVVAAVLAEVGPRTRLVLIDHITSPTALVFPVEKLCAELAHRGVDVLVDGAHAPGMVPLELDRLGATYYTGNLHKWVCAPKGAAILWARKDRQAGLRPPVISHGANTPRTDRSRFHLEFDWTGTQDVTALLSAPTAIAFMATLDPEGWPGVMKKNRELAAQARRLLNDRLQQDPLCPERLLGSMATVRLPPAPAGQPRTAYPDALQERLEDHFRVQVPIVPYPLRTVRVSAQRYNRLEQYARLADALEAALAEEARAA